MPTVILLDVSLSMTRPVSMTECTEEYNRRNLAIHGMNTLLDFCSTQNKMEFMSLVVYSSLWEQLAPFSRDYDTLKAATGKIGDLYSKTCTEGALRGVGSLVVDEWGVATPCQIVLITDGSTGVGDGSLRQSLAHKRDSTEDKFPLPFPFACKINIVCLSQESDASLQQGLLMYQRLIDIGGGGGEIFVPEGALSLASVHKLFTKLAEKYFAPYVGALKCGHLSCNIQLFPAPDIYDKDHDFEHLHKEVAPEIQICGFLDINDIASPPSYSRHLVLPTSTSNTSIENGNASKSEDGEAEEEAPDGKSAAFTVLLHGSLKVEGMIALVQVTEDWHGMMYSFADSKKKSNLMLSLFQPGTHVLPWLGHLNHLAPMGDFTEPPYGDDDNKSPFPVRPVDRRSYTQNCVVWIKPSGLQADIQKILRHARKLPEKQQHFYKELNRLRRAALSLGFYELLTAVSQMLERECTLLPGTAHPDAALQLTHAANSLQADSVYDVVQNILPLRTNFSGD